MRLASPSRKSGECYMLAFKTYLKHQKFSGRVWGSGRGPLEHFCYSVLDCDHLVTEFSFPLK